MTDFTWTGAAHDGLFKTAGNWTPTGGPPNASSNIILNNGATIALPTGGINVDGMTVSGAVAFSGGGAVTVNNNGVALNPGSALNLGGSTLDDDDALTFVGTGNYTLSNGTLVDQTGLTINSGENLILSQMTVNTHNAISGAGNLTLAGSTLNSLSGANPTVNINLTTVYAGQTHNIIDVPEYDGSLGQISNLGYGTTFNASSGSTHPVLSLVPVAGQSGVYQLVATVSGNAVTLSTHVTLQSGLTPQEFTTDANGNFSFTGAPPICFLAGSRLLTDRGEVPIEALQIGDRLATPSGETKTVRWVGHSVFHAKNRAYPDVIWPVQVIRDAFGEGLPSRDLWLSPGHCVAYDGVLIPVGVLCNGRSIVQHERSSVEYWHVELEQHGVILAEGLPVESYLDTGNRLAFANGGAFQALHPDIRAKHWSETCLPYTNSGPVVEAAKARLANRARRMRCSLTSEPDLHVVADGRRVDAIALSERRYLFILPPDVRAAALRSRSFVPVESDPAAIDRRTLGVCVTRLQIDGDDVPLDAALGQGWNGVDTDGSGLIWRWTNGMAPLPAKVRSVLVDLGGPGSYWVEKQVPHLSIVA